MANIDELISTEGTTRILFHLEYHCGIHAEALLAEVVIRHWTTDRREDTAARPIPARIAVVGDEVWERWVRNFLHPALKADVQYFTLQQKSKAWIWLHEQ